MRIGTGFDVHAFARDRKLILGGVPIEHELGLEGHSDADVLTHAVMDALLGTGAYGDIGMQFPDTASEYRGADSVDLLRSLVKKYSFRLVNMDCTIICQKPKLAPYIESMRMNLADALSTDVSNVSVKATTTEKLGFTGRNEGIAAMVSVLVE